MRYSNLAQILQEKKDCHNTGITFIGAQGNDQFLSFAELYVSALKSLSFLVERGIKKNDHIMLQLDENRSFIIIFWACILGGIVPIPLTVGLNDEHKQKFLNIWSFLSKPYVIISQANLINLQLYMECQPAFSEIQARALIEEEVLAADCLAEMGSVNGRDTAFIQFSSGSTGLPKGVILTHENLLVNMAAISKASEYSANDRTMSWMPLTHDMGLIGFHLNPMFSGMHQYLMPTQLFIRRPGLWLEKASFYKASILCSPNFGYKYTLAHFNPSDADVNLSAVRLLYNGAEPISERLCREFLKRFSLSGLQVNAMCPVYGLAEGTLAVSISSLSDEVVSVTLDRKKLRAGERIAFCQRGENSATFVNVGKPIENCSIRITNDQDLPVNDEVLGHIQIKGSSVTSGYYNNKTETEKVITRDGWLRTGDLGFMLNGALYVTGRNKDIIFINGQNFYPHDIERLSEDVPGIELNKIVVTGFSNDVTEREETIAFVFYRGSIEAFVPIVKHLRSHISLHAGLVLDRILPVKNIPRTTSGKLQRFRLLEQYREGLFLNVEKSLASQFALTEAKQVAEDLPETSVEARLTFIWRQVLNDKSIGPLDNFFACGGNSLKAAEMLGIIRKEFEVELPFISFYEAPTVRQLVEKLNSSFFKKCGTIPGVRMKKYYPSSFAQKRLYYLWRVDDQSTAYNIPVAFEIKGGLSIKRLEHCVRQLIDRHESLRMSFRLRRTPEFMLHNDVNFLLECRSDDGSGLGETLRNMVQPFDLHNGPLFRIKLIKISDQRFILFADFHHIVFDGVSVTLFVDELLKLYSARDLDQSLVGYTAYASWEREMVRKENKRLKNYWKKILDEVPILQLPLDFQRPPIFDNRRGAKTMFHLDATVTRALKMLAKDNACTLQIVMLTLYEVLLSKYTGSNNMIIGIPVDRRIHTDLRRTVGMLVNTVAIKCEMPDDLPLGEQIKKTRNVVWEALKHADFPFEKLVGMSGATRDISRNPVFDTMFVYQDMQLVKSIDQELSLERHFFDPGIAKCDITLEVYENGDSLDCLIEYASTLFKEQTISRLITHFCNLVSDAARHPQKRLSELVVISESEFNEYVIKYNDSASPYDADKTLVTLFEEVVKNYPDRIAVEYENQILTFTELNQKAEEQASFLTANGFGPQSIGVVLLPNNPDLIVSILAILKVGGIYLPIDVDLPLERISAIICDSKCSIVVSNTAGISRLGELVGRDSCRIFNIEVDGAKQLPVRVSGYAACSDDAAYVLYTSGTSGVPKGVVITHRSLVNYVTWAAKQYLPGTVAAFPLFTSISFDLTVTSVFVPLITGNKIVIYNESERVMSIERILNEDNVEVIKLTPSHLRLISENHSLDLSNSRIRTLIVGGEQLDTQLAKTILERFGGNVTIFNEYGPTEATVGCMIHRFRPDEERPCVAIGIPAANTRIYLLDKYMKPVPVGVTGEIYIGGDGLAKGYLYSERLTRSKFLPDPFLSGALIYETGDLARRLPGGELEYIGRRDRQIKVNGHRIELQEIEGCLTGYPDISAAFVTFRSRENNNLLYGYFVSAVDVDLQDLRTFMVARLPRYMVPVHFVKLDKIPLTRNGKIDHSVLPDYKDSAHRPDDTYTLREIDRTFMEVWGDLMGRRDLTIRDNFFELGGDSIKAVQLASRLREKGITVSVKEILTHQTIQAIIPYIGISNEVNLYDQDVVAGFLDRAPIEEWFFSCHFKNQNYYNQSVVLRLNKVIDMDALRQAFEKLIEHHDSLRLNYDPVRMRLFYNNTHLQKDFELLEWKAQNGQYTDAGFDLFCTAVKGSFDITRSLLLKAAVITSGKSADLLFITAHHLIIDGFSWRILLADLRNFYNAFSSGQAVDVPKKTASVKEWRKLLWKLIESGKFQEQEKYWQDLSDNFTIPQDFAARDWSVSNARTVRGHLDRFIVDELFKYGAKHKLEMNVILTAAVARTLHEWTGAKTSIVELENHGRHLNEIDISRTIGWFTTMHNIRLEWNGQSLVELLNSVKESVANVPDHGIGQGIKEHLMGNSGQNGARLTELRMNYLGQFDRELANELFTYISNQSGTNVDVCNQMTTKIAVDIMIFDGELILDITYNVGAHKESTINWLKEQLLSSVNLILQHIQKADDPKLVPSDFDTIDLEQAELDALFK